MKLNNDCGTTQSIPRSFLFHPSPSTPLSYHYSASSHGSRSRTHVPHVVTMLSYLTSTLFSANETAPLITSYVTYQKPLIVYDSTVIVSLHSSINAVIAKIVSATTYNMRLLLVSGSEPT